MTEKNGSSTTSEITIAGHRMPVRERTYKKAGKEYRSFRVRLTRDIDPATGRRRIEDVTAPTMEALVAKLEERIRPYGYLTDPYARDMTFQDLVLAWRVAGACSWEPTTQQAYEAITGRYHLPLTRGMRLQEVDAPFLQELYGRLEAAGVSRCQIRRIHQVFRSIFTYAVNRRYLLASPCEGLFVPKGIFRVQDALSEEQQTRLLTAVKDTNDEGLIATLLFCGLRVSEALGLTWENVDLNTGQIRVVATLQRTIEDGLAVYRLRPYNKNRRERTVFLSPTEIAYLKHHHERQEKMRALAKEAWTPVIDDLVFADACGQPLAYGSVERRFKRLVRRLGSDMAGVHLHTLRHTAASNFYHRTKDVLLTKEFLGHADVRTTELYTHSRKEDLMAIADARDGDVRGIIPGDDLSQETA